VKPETTIDAELRRFFERGPVDRVSTGFPDLDGLCGGGFTVPRRVFIVGAPGASKTGALATMAKAAFDAGFFVGFIAIDEEIPDLHLRFVESTEYPLTDLETPPSEEFKRAAIEYADRYRERVQLWGYETSVPEAAEKLAAKAASEGRKAALFIDSLHAAATLQAKGGETAKELVEKIVKVIRECADKYRMLLVASCESNREAYGDSGTRTGNLSAGAESRTIEFAAQTLIVLRVVEGHEEDVAHYPNLGEAGEVAGPIIHFRVAKNRRAREGEWWGHFDRETHRYVAVEKPKTKGELKRAAKAAETTAKAEQKATTKAAAKAAAAEKPARDDETLLRIVSRNPGVSRQSAMGAGKLNRDRFDAALGRLGSKVRVERGGGRSPMRLWPNG